MLFDTHLHIVDRKALNYPWLDGAGTLNRDHFYADYAREAQRCGITDVLHMEVDVDPADIGRETTYLEKLAAEPASLLRGAISACRPEESDFATHLEHVIDNPFVKGFRRVLHVMPDALSEMPLFRENIARLSGTRLTFDLCVLPRQHQKAMALIDLNPDVRFILDHCGVPDIAGGSYLPWAQTITEIARRPNVTAKISGVIAYADPQSWTVDTIRPYVEHTIGAFGWDRVIWGSDWPVNTLGGGLSTWVATTHALTTGCSQEERNGLYQANARRLWAL